MLWRTKSKEHRKKLRQRLRTMESYGMRAVSEPKYHCRPINSGGTDTLSFIDLAKEMRDECAPHLPFDPNCIASNCVAVYEDKRRDRRQAWLLFKDDVAIGYLVAHATEYYFCTALSTSTEVMFVTKSERNWKAFKCIMDTYQEWALSIDAVQMFTGVARVDAEIAEKMQKIFPRLGFNWCGSYFVKEIGR